MMTESTDEQEIHMSTENIHPEIESIMEDADESVLGPIREEALREFKKLESNMFDSLGDPHGEAQIFTIKASSVTEENIAEMGKSDSKAKLIGKELSLGDTVMSLDAVYLGDIYEGLADMRAASEIAMDKDICGVIFRVGGYASESALTTDIKPSEAEDRIDSIVTGMVTNGSLMTVCRLLDSSTIESNYTSVEKHEMGESKLLDALMTFWFAPQQLMIKEPGLWQTIKAQIEFDLEHPVLDDDESEDQ
jgi:hypothetical protein